MSVSIAAGHAPETLDEMLKRTLPASLYDLLDKRDGAAQLVPKLLRDVDPKSEEHLWDHCALYYSSRGRHHEALSIYYALYDALMDLQEKNGVRVAKGTPLVRISDAHATLGHPVTARRYMMLTMCEDAINFAGKIPAETTGIYFRAVWQYGISHDQLNDYASKIWSLNQQHLKEARFPEWLLQEMDQRWLTEYPSPGEAGLYLTNATYIRWLLSELGTGDGQILERLAHYLLSCVPGFRTHMRTRSHSTDYDVVCASEGPAFDFRSELGRYFLCECKDWKKRANVTAVIKFGGVLRSAKCRFGIIFSKNGITGTDKANHAKRELLKIFQQDSLQILVFSEADLKQVAAGSNFFSLLRAKYEQNLLDLPEKALLGGA